LVWSRVYFYGVIGVALATAFFASPAKAYLIDALNRRSGTPGSKLKHSQSHESLDSKHPILGLPPNPQQDLNEVITEVRAEIDARQRRGIRRDETVPTSG